MGEGQSPLLFFFEESFVAGGVLAGLQGVTGLRVAALRETWQKAFDCELEPLVRKAGWRSVRTPRCQTSQLGSFEGRQSALFVWASVQISAWVASVPGLVVVGEEGDQRLFLAAANDGAVRERCDGQGASELR